MFTVNYIGTTHEEGGGGGVLVLLSVLGAEGSGGRKGGRGMEHHY